ncbi:vWA domain-containing protein [Euzebya tangerina]|uniref:vWA domain-containing protein n=1 Tax=Euzebya tangerina TaxID=591198 RepID=UPI00196A2C5F|nr:VWA domain-containing protein [Euzebya tangerina]
MRDEELQDDTPPVRGGPRADMAATATAFARTVRAAGVPVTTGRVQAFVDSLALLDPTSTTDVYWAGHSTLCSDPQDFGRYDRAFHAFFTGEAPHERLKVAPPDASPPDLQSLTAPLTDGHDADDEAEILNLEAGASGTEILRQRDLASLNAGDRDVVNRLLATLRLPGEARRTRRHEPWHRGSINRQATVREALHGMGDPRRLRHRRQQDRPRAVVLLVDVSGSMTSYADALLRFAHVAVGRGPRTRPTEAFTVGTRLTRITRELRHRDPDTAMAAVAGAIPDWSGGTRLGDGLKEWLDRWGQRGLARGAVMVILSDGWERGDAGILGEQMARLQRLAHRVVWSNPRKAAPGYRPLVGGMAAALPHVDQFLSGHSVAALERLAAVVAGVSTEPNRGRVGTHRASR